MIKINSEWSSISEKNSCVSEFFQWCASLMRWVLKSYMSAHLLAQPLHFQGSEELLWKPRWRKYNVWSGKMMLQCWHCHWLSPKTEDEDDEDALKRSAPWLMVGEFGLEDTTILGETRSSEKCTLLYYAFHLIKDITNIVFV